MRIDVINIDGKEYYELSKLEINNKTYVVLASALTDDFIIRNLVNENGKTFMEKLENKEEIDLVLEALKAKIEK